ncbi:type III-A CRISPR-associated RAMP protein Csm5 [Clostridium sp. cel8]|uniref:type III-A CRISPR-associated RAMP protein Csm5 n=1 Tax=Clostridium sp. cel8 TaxID=2663123 RepID=UPI0015F77FB0|nr:type III-A CRISPR-associated RAMP protein Csm5 [Clostridium sp. cel8]MBA5851160.1 type III-A CRISPR-associated RAMP protein Csm5 [Clostridium sp. cel8]
MKFKIKVLSPVHIKSGNTISPYADFIYDNNCLLYMHNEKLWKDISKNETILDEYVQVVKNRDTNSKEKYTLNDFLKRNGINIEKYVFQKVNCNSDIKSMEVSEIIKTSGRPYIPGSSIKGAIRTAILYNYLKLNGFDFDKLVDISAKKNKKNIYVGEDVMRKGKKNIQSDIMKFLQVSDTNCADIEDISVNLEYGVDYINVKRSNKLSTKMPTAMESINKGTVFQFNIKCVKENKFFNDEEDVLKTIRKFYKDNIKRHIKVMEESSEEIFSNIISKYKEYLNAIDDGKCILRIGSSKNFYDNTICNLFDEKDVSEKIAGVKYSLFPRNDWFILDSEKNYIKESLGWIEIMS